MSQHHHGQTNVICCHEPVAEPLKYDHNRILLAGDLVNVTGVKFRSLILLKVLISIFIGVYHVPLLNNLCLNVTIDY